MILFKLILRMLFIIFAVTVRGFIIGFSDISVGLKGVVCDADDGDSFGVRGLRQGPKQNEK